MKNSITSLLLFTCLIIIGWYAVDTRRHNEELLTANTKLSAQNAQLKQQNDSISSYAKATDDTIKLKR